ncbi:histidine phosphatase family protein, partial [Glaesserella parasuis]|nr:histidine phosphatase family protein [Glaesserella parasuis]MDE3979876.1 histidine phosphatase family protein [Glaesserella parasuis]
FVQNTALSIIKVEGEKRELIEFNKTEHL